MAKSQHGPILAIDIEGEVLLWCQGVWSGERHKEAKLNELLAPYVDLSFHGPRIQAGPGREEKLLLDDETPFEEEIDFLALAAAGIGVAPGRARLLEAPESVWEAIAAVSGGCVE